MRKLLKHLLIWYKSQYEFSLDRQEMSIVDCCDYLIDKINEGI
jgi:hypothetical protein